MSNTWHPTSRGTLTVHTVSQAELNVRLAQDIAQRLAAAIQARGFAVLSVSGGKSPVALFEALRVIDIDWAHVRVTLVDERCVPCTHADSNAGLVHSHLLQDLAAKAQLLPMVRPLLPGSRVAVHSGRHGPKPPKRIDGSSFQRQPSASCRAPARASPTRASSPKRRRRPRPTPVRPATPAKPGGRGCPAVRCEPQWHRGCASSGSQR